MPESIAVVGSACRFPGASSSPSKLWELLRDPKDVLSDFSSDRLSLSRFYHRDGEHHGSTDVNGKSYLLSEDYRVFDASFFNISPLEADGMDPQQRILLETVYEALESAGCTLEQIQGSLTSVHVGVMNADYFDIQLRDPETLPTYNATGTARSIISNRISYFFNLKGPSMTIDTACSSSLVALHQAVQSLRSGDATAAIVAGANLILDPSMYIAESKLHMLSPDSRSHMWDKSANGYARGEGFAALLLKPLSRAKDDGDHIEGIIRETGVNSDGRTKGITMPNPAAQTALIQQTYRNAGLDPVADRCQYFECHGTGTLAGDPVEARAVRDAFFPVDVARDQLPEADASEKLFVGSIKTVIGHLEGCAGLAGVLKALLAIKNRTIPPNMHFSELNPAIAPFYEHLQIPTKALPWPETQGMPLRASVNSFGFGGTNAHAIIESHNAATAQAKQRSAPDQCSSEERFVGPLIFSANTGSSLLASVRMFTDYIKSNPSLDLEDLTWVLQAKRTTFPVKAFFSGSTRQRLLNFMEKFVTDAGAGPKVAAGTRVQLVNPSEVPGILGVFTGQGAQWASMGRGLILSSPLFRQSIERCEATLARLPDAPSWSLRDELMADEANSRLSEAALSQPLCTALQIAMVDLLRAAGIKLNAVVGHSSGEIAAVYATGIITATAAIQIAYYRGYHAKLARGAQGQSGAMMAVGISFNNALSVCASPEFAGRMNVAASNSPLSVTFTGDVDAIMEAKEHFDREKTFARLLRVDTAYHSHHMLPCSEPYLQSLKACNIQVSPPRSDCIWISSVRGDTDLLEGDLEALKGQYWMDNMLNTVLFSQAIEVSIWNGGPFDVAVELGPHPTLKGPAEQTLKAAFGSAPSYAGFMRRHDSEVEAFSGGVGYVWSCLGPSFVDFDGYRKAFQGPNASTSRMLKDLPSYSWDHDKAHWRESRISRKYRLRNDRSQELLGRRVPDDSEHEMRWRNILRLTEIPWIRGHEFQGQVLFPGAGYVAMALEAAKAIADRRPVKLYEVQDMVLSRALVIPESPAGVETVFTSRLIDASPRTSNDATLEAEFACYFCSDEATGSLVKACMGRLLIQLGRPSTQELPPRLLQASNLVPVDMERFYSAMSNVGLNYQGLFRGMLDGKRSLGFASATASWLDSDMGCEYVVHPAFLDVAFQSLYAAFSSAASGDIWAPYLPVRIRRLAVNPNANYHSVSGEINMDADTFVTTASSTLLEGDIHLYDFRGDQMSLQVEGIAMKAVSEPEPSNDKLLFAETIWDTDVSFGLGGLSQPKEVTGDIALVEALDRTALYYYQALFREVAPEEIHGFKWYHQRMFKAADTLLASIRNGQHPVAKREWLEDSQETIMALNELHQSRVDLRLIHAVGRNLVSVVRGETQLLEVMLEDNMLNRFYMEGHGFSVVNDGIATAVKQITYKHPQVKILEIGAGTGGTTRSILDTIGSSYSSYTYTDISTGFFENAAEKFRDQSSKTVFKVLDIEKDPIEQGFPEQSYDIIIAANVLHATRNLTETMQHVRSLLKVGGFLIMMEITGPKILRTQFIMGGLPGWWLGADEGRVLSPAISAVEWDELLQNTGFSGVDSVLHDMSDELKHSFSLIVSQAVDEKFELLRDPLASINSIPGEEQLLIIGGKTLPIARTASEIQKRLSSWKRHITIAKSIESPESARLSPMTSIICLEELDRPLFSETMTAARMQSLQDLFINAKDVLWVTNGRMSDSPCSNMTVGIGRALLTEIPHVNLQFLDMDVGRTPVLSAIRLVEAFLRLKIASLPEYAKRNMLWKTEPEIVFDGDKVLIPRILPNKIMNDRYNSARRLITKTVATEETCVEIISSGKSLQLVQKSLDLKQKALSGYARIRVKYSLMLPSVDSKPYYLCTGLLERTQQAALALCQFNASTVEVLSCQVIVLNETPSCRPAMLQTIADHLIARSLHSRVPKAGSILMYEPEESLAVTLSKDSHWSERRVFFASSKRSRVPHDWIKFHPRASQRAIKHCLPRDLTCIVDFSRSLHCSIKSCLSPGCTIVQPSVLDEMLLPTARHDLLANSYSDAVAALPGSHEPATFRVQDLAAASSSALSHSHLTDWSGASSLEVAVQPLSTTGLFSPGHTYLLVGMTGELGLSLSRWMVQNGARYIVLTSRSADVETLWLKDIRKDGADIQVYKMDVSDRSSVHSVVNTVRDTMPPIAGVCNAAMVLSDRLFVDMDAETMNNTLRPKVDGTRYLDELFYQTPLDFFIMFSSLASIIGNAGQSNYHAANLFMASFTTQRRKRGLAASIIHIGLVTDVGYVARRGRAMEDHLRKLFFMPLSESDVHHFFAEAVLAGPPDSGRQAEIIIGLQMFIDSPDAKVRPPWHSNPRFSHFVMQEIAPKEQRQTMPTAADIQQRLEEAESNESAMQIVQEAFSSKLESMMQLTPNSVNVNVPLIDLGCDSLLAVEIRTWFLKELRMDVPVLRVLSGDTVAQLCNDATKKSLALKLDAAQREKPTTSTNTKDVVTDKSNQVVPNVTVSQRVERFNYSEGVDAERDTISDDGSENSALTYSPGSSTFPPVSGTETPQSLLTSSTDLSKEVDINPLDFENERSVKRAEKMSYAQSRLWFLTKYLKDPTTYNVTVSYDIKGSLQMSRLKRALAATIYHHESLQTCFFEQPESGGLMQGVLSSPSYLLKHVQSGDETDVEQEFELLKTQVWDLEKGQTFGVTIVSQSPSQHTIIFGYHHIVMDGVSWHFFLRDVDLAYQLRNLKHAPKEYIDFSREQLQAAENGDFASQLHFWQEQHTQLPGVMLLLPFARVKARAPLHSYESHVQSKEIGQSLVSEIKRASQTLQATPFHFHLAVIQVIFARFLNIGDLCIGVADANRTNDDFAETVGFFLNLLPLRFQVERSDSFTELVQRTSRKVLAALSNSEVPFDLVLEKLNVPRSPAYSPLFQVAVNYRMGALLQIPLGECKLEIGSAEDAKNPYDISFGITETSVGTCVLELTCQNHLYTPEASKLLMDTYVHLLETLSTNASLQIQDCSMMDPAKINHALSLGRGPRVQFDWPTTLSERFDNARKACANDIAIKDETAALTYSQVAAKVNSVARAISDEGLGSGTRVAVLCKPSADSIACMLAILRMGCVYVPLDLSLPKGRHVAMLENCKPSLILCHSVTHELAIELNSACKTNMSAVDISKPVNIGHEEVKNLAHPNIPAFLLYTSGSTGIPKGILLSQANFVNFLALKTHELLIGKEVVLQQSSLGFDMSIIQIFCALANGGTLVVAPREARGDPIELSKLISQEKVTFTIATPSEYLMMLRYGNEFLKEHISWRQACMGGEAVTEQLMWEFQRLNRSHITLTNCYGPTEITAAATFQNVSLASVDQNLVGKALPNYSIYIVDENLEPVPAGLAGEICIGGAGVALGYWDLPNQTESKFLLDSYATAEDIAKGWKTMYRTGDKGRLLPNGSVVFMGRIDGDTQVKLRGLRIELEDVANALLKARSDLLSDAVVTARGDPAFLVAHIVFAPGKSMSDGDLQLLAKNLPLPQYMAPSMIVPLERLPSNSNGKIDRKAIESLPLPVQSHKSKPVERLTLSEGELRLLWQSVLPQTGSSSPLRPDSDFFMHGGNSILLMKLQGAIREAIGVSMSIMELYQASTLSRMAAHISAKKVEQLPHNEAIDWIVETAVPDAILVTPRREHGLRQIKDRDREVLLTGATSFLGGAVLASLLEDASVSQIHCIAVPPESQATLPESEKVISYTGSLLTHSLGLSEAECIKLRSSVDLIIHGGANGHCLNNYSSLRVPNLHSTQFLISLALPHSIPVHFLSSNRVSLLSGSTALPPVSVSSFQPKTDGSEGFTATKWASERFLENVAHETGLGVCMHRACAVTGDKAPNEDALNALLRYSVLMRAVPRFDNFEGFFDFRDVHEVANEIVKEALAPPNISGSSNNTTSVRFVHHSSGVKVPMNQFRQHMESLHGCRFEELSVTDWIEKAMEAGIDPLITSYLEAMVQKREIIKFPYLGEPKM